MHTREPTALAPDAGRLDQFNYGLAQPLLGVRLLLREPGLRERAIVPVLVVLGVCVAATVLAGQRPGAPFDRVSTFFLTLIAVASMPPVLFANGFSRLAVATRDRLGLGRRRPHLRALGELLREVVQQAIVLAIGLLPLLILAEAVPVLGGVLGWVLGALWTLHWIVVEAFDAARTLSVDADDATDEPGAAPWFARIYNVGGGGRVRPIRWFARLVTRLGARWRGEVALIEAHPWLAAGFSLGAAVLLALPGINLLFRPVIVVAAAHVHGRLEAARDTRAEQVEVAAPGPWKQSLVNRAVGSSANEPSLPRLGDGERLSRGDVPCYRHAMAVPGQDSSGEPRADVTLTWEQALVVVGFGAVSSDGAVGVDEVTAVARGLSALGILDSDAARDELLHEVMRRVHTHGLGSMTGAALPVVAGERREAVLRLALAVVIVDGSIPDEELAYVRGLQRSLEISDERYDQLLAEA